jgi:hypothetical protein
LDEKQSFAEGVLRWFTDVSDHEAGASLSRALAWLDTPNARVAVAARVFPHDIDRALELAREYVRGAVLPEWGAVESAELWLRQAIDQACAELKPLDEDGDK